MIREYADMWWRPSFATLLYPYQPPYITKPKECQKLFCGSPVREAIFSVPKNLKLLAISMFETFDNVQSVPVPPSRAGKELIRSSMRDQGPVKSVLLKTLENGSPRLDPDNALSSKSRESNAEDNSGDLPSNLLVEDVKVCDTCGNAGYEELLAVCNSCNEGAEHTKDDLVSRLFLRMCLCGRASYCMRIQMDSLPEGEWLCEMCQIIQRQGCSKTSERLLVPSKLLGRSTSINNRSKLVLNQGGSRSRLEDRLNHKKPRIIPVRNSPSKAPILQMSVKRSPNDYLVTHTSRKLATESTTWATFSTLPPPTSPVSTPLAKPLLTRENTFKSAPDTGKVKFLAPSGVASFSSGARAIASKPACLASQSPIPAAAGNKSRLASVSNIPDSSTPLNKATSLNICRASPTTSPTPLLSKSSSKKLSPDFSTLTKPSAAKLSAEFPSFLLNSNFRQGNVTKGYGQSKNIRDGGVFNGGISMPSSIREVLSCASEFTGSKFVRLGRNASSGLTGERSPSLDIPRLTLESSRAAHRSGQICALQPFLDTPRPPVQHGRGAGHHLLNAGNKDKAAPRFEHAFGVGSSEFGREMLESDSVPVFSGMQTKPNTSIWSEPRSGDSSSTWCFSCKTVGHSIQYCPNGSLLPSEQKVMNGFSNSQGASLKPFKNSVQVFRDMDTVVPMVELEPDLDVKTSLLTALPLPIASVPGGCSSDLEKSKFVLLSSTPTDLLRQRSSNVKIHDSLAAGSMNPSLLNGTSLQQLVTGENLVGVANGDISLRPDLKVEFGPGCHLWTSSEAYDNEGLPEVLTTENARADSTVTAFENSTLLLVKSDRGSSPNASYVTGPKVSEEHPIQLIDAVFGPAPQVLQRVHPAWGPRAPRSEALSPHSVQGQGSGHDGYPSRLVQSFSPSGIVMYSQGSSMSYLSSQRPPFSPPYAPPAPPPISSRTSRSPATQVDAAVPSSAIAWRGAFEVNDGQSKIMFDEILAHVSTKAVAKVHEVATSMPQQLRLEQVQRAADIETWPRQFDIRPPTDGSIALYFFASNGESFEKFRHTLVDKMVARDLVLRAHVDDAELLIYPSNKLSKKFQRWHGHIFLWGVFRARKQVGKTVSTSTIVVKGPLVAVAPCFEATKIPPYLVAGDAPVFNIMAETKHLNSSSSGCDSTGVVDMEVDMEGGNECGMSDKPCRRLDSANPPSTPLSPLGASMKAPTASTNLGFVPDCLLSNSDKVDNVQDKPTSNMAEDLDLPPGFAPALVLRPKPAVPETLTPGLTLAPGFKNKTQVPQQVDLGSSVSADEDPEQGGSELKGNMTSLDVLKNSSTPQVSPLSAPNLVEHVESLLPITRPPTTKPSRSNTRSPSRVREMERDNVRGQVCKRAKNRERRDPDTKYERWDRSWERAREVHRDRDHDRDYEREKDRQRPRIRDRDCDIETYDRPKERARTRDKYRVRERERARVRDCETVRHRERERVRDWQRERFLDRKKDRNSYWPRDNDQDLDSRIRFRRSRSCSRSRSPKRITSSWSHGAGRRRVRSRTPPRQMTRSPSLSQRYPSSYRQRSASGSDSPGSQSLEILQGSVIVGLRPWKLDCERVEGKGSNISDKIVEDKGSRFSSRWKLARPVVDTRSGSEGASNSKTVSKLGHSNTMIVSRSVTPVLDMNEGVSEDFSAEGATSSTSLPDLNTDSVESGVAFHDFLPADECGPPREPDKTRLHAEQAFFPGVARGTVPHNFNTGLNFRNRDAKHTLARERWGFAVSSIGSSRSNHTSRSSRCQFLHAPRLTDTVHNSSPNLELVLGGRETPPEHSFPLPLFVDGHARSTSNLGFSLNAKIPDLRVSLSTPHQLGPPGIVCGGTASLSLSLAVPQYRREGNSWDQVEGHGDVSNTHDVDFSLTL